MLCQKILHTKWANGAIDSNQVHFVGQCQDVNKYINDIIHQFLVKAKIPCLILEFEKFSFSNFFSSNHGKSDKSRHRIDFKQTTPKRTLRKLHQLTICAWALPGICSGRLVSLPGHRDDFSVLSITDAQCTRPMCLCVSPKINSNIYILTLWPTFFKH